LFIVGAVVVLAGINRDCSQPRRHQATKPPRGSRTIDKPCSSGARGS
jgi:hypothetical protein